MASEAELVHEQIIRRSGSAGTGYSSSAQEAISLRLPGWYLQTQNGSRWVCTIQTDKLRFDLSMQPTQRAWFQGFRGFSQKGPRPEHSSHYITVPHLAAEGRIRVRNKSLDVKGFFWMDHEWSSTLLPENARGWDWIGVHGLEGECLIAFQIRNQDTRQPPIWTHAALRSASGQITNFRRVKFETITRWKSSRTGVEYPVRQRVLLDDQEFILEPLMEDQELDARVTSGNLYWEGAVHVKTSYGEPWGRGYLEMTGYDKPIIL
jgi:predicted secreted hydrolase